MHRSVAVWALVFFALLSGCGGSGGGDSDGNKGKPAKPLELTRKKLGVTFHHGSAGVLRRGGEVAKRAVERTKSTFGAAFLDVQSYDEHSWRFGEWEVQPPPKSFEKYRAGSKFRNEPNLGQFEPRATDLVEEVEKTFGKFGKDGFGRLGIVFDVWRMRGDWYVRWDGVLDEKANRIGEGPYGFYRADMSGELASQIAEVVGSHEPDYLVVGSDMGRLLGRKSGDGIAPDEFSNYRQFYRNVVRDVRKNNPRTRIGVGFDWNRFVRYVAPAFGEGSSGEVPPRKTLERAFRTVIYPTVDAGGMLALKSYRPASAEEESYDFLADLDEMFDMEGKTFVWYSVGSPVNDSASYRKQRTYLEKFVEWNKGVEPDLVVWRALVNIDGADRSGQDLGGRCRTMVETDRFDLQKRHCFDGLFETGFQPKEVFEELNAAAKGKGGSDENGSGSNGEK